jgi:hypothetical protein
MRQIELVSWESLLSHVEKIKISLEDIYEVEMTVKSEQVPLDRLHPTEDFLEKDKLALVFMKVVSEGYNVPIIAVEHGKDYYVLDGHHRSFISKKLMKKSLGAHTLIFPTNRSYRFRLKRSIGDLPIKDVVPIDDPILKTWSQILTILKYYEALYKISFFLKKKNVFLKDLVPTQLQTSKRQIESIKKLLVPIVCVRHQEKYYILDGHARSLRARQLGLKSIEAMFLVPEVEIDLGIVRTTTEMELKSLEDLNIFE